MADSAQGDLKSRARAAERRLERDFLESGDPFAAAVKATRMAMLITDPNQPDNPIIFANHAFSELTGYASEDVIGRNCRFLQGPQTDPEARARLRHCIEQQEDLHIEILNYRKDGEPFWNSLFVSPVRDEGGEVAFYFASQIDVTERKETDIRTQRLADDLAEAKTELEAKIEQRTRALVETLQAKTQLLNELDHRVKNNLQLMISLVNLEKRERSSESERQALEAIGVRLQALGLVHRKLYNDGAVGEFALGAFIPQIVDELQTRSGRADVSPEYDVDDISVPAGKAGPIALLLNELIAAAFRFSYQGRGGAIRLILKAAEGDCIVFSIADHEYTRLEKETAEASIGARIVSILARQLDAKIDWRPADPAVLVSVAMPRAMEAVHAPADQ